MILYREKCNPQHATLWLLTACQCATDPQNPCARLSTTRPPQLTGGGQSIARFTCPSPSALYLLPSLYGVGDGDSSAAGDASVLGAFFLAVCFFGVGDGEAFVVAAVVEVAVVPCCCVQETTNARPIKAVIKDKTVFFIVCS